MSTQGLSHGLSQAQQLADTGRLADAAKLCETLARTYGTSPEVYYLLGLVHDALGDVQQAVTSYRKVLFLQPNHGDAAGHLAPLIRKQGDVAGADRLQARARRMGERDLGGTAGDRK